MTDFFSKYPALFYGLCLFLGIENILNGSLFLVLPFLVVFFFTLNNRIRAILGIATICFGSILASFSQSYTLFEESISGKAYIDIQDIKFTKGKYGNYWHYRGILKTFLPDTPLNRIPKNCPIFFKLKYSKSLIRPLANKSYLVPCILSTGLGKRYFAQIKKEEPWLEIPQTYSLAEWRFQLKSTFKKYLKRKFSSKTAGNFLAGLATGEFDDNTTQAAFSRFGLLHLMAISGFHFSLIARVLFFFFRPIFKDKIACALVMILLTAYFLFLGSGPSVLRAWMTLIVLYSSLFCSKSPVALNSLGFSLLISLVFDPLLCENLGFQFSFLLTASILLCHELFDNGIKKIFIPRSKDDVQKMSLVSKHGLLILNFFRPSLALSGVTTLAAIPLSLFYFKAFPLLGIVYNLFFPFLVGISLFLLLLGLVLTPFASPIHSLNSVFTSFILKMTLDIPVHFDFSLKYEKISSEYLIFYYTLFFALIVFFKPKKEHSFAFKGF